MLPAEFLKTCGLSEFTYDHKPAVRIPYFGVAGEEFAVRFRIALDGDRFRWKSGTKPCLYGLHRLSDAQKERVVVLVEGESDCHTLWFHGIPAIGIPGAANWREDRDARHLEGIETMSSSNPIAAGKPSDNGFHVQRSAIEQNWSVCQRKMLRRYI